MGENIFSILQPSPLINDHSKTLVCDHCQRDLSQYSFTRKETHLIYCQQKANKKEVIYHKSVEFKVPAVKKKFVYERDEALIVAPEGRIISRCECPYTKVHLQQKVQKLFDASLSDDKINYIHVENDPFVSFKRMGHLDQLRRDMLRLTLKVPGDITVIASNGELKWHSIILQVRTVNLLPKCGTEINLSQYKLKVLQVYEAYMYGGDISHCNAYQKDLLSLSKAYGPNELKIYLEEEYVMEQTSDSIYSRTDYNCMEEEQ
uniref:BTB domain-containing protein n=1 Tax=Rhabditophanes sp. KR3021 TaxID=114890 RepID=A0AC35TJQ6_9BILA